MGKGMIARTLWYAVFIFIWIPSVSNAQQAAFAGNVAEDSLVIKENKISGIKSPLLIDIQQTIDSLNKAGAKHSGRPNLYYRLAVVFARMKMYPLALKCFYRSTRKIRKAAVMQDSMDHSRDSLSLSFSLTNEDILQTPAGEALAINGDTVLVNNILSEKKSKVVKGEEVLRPFNDGKEANAYGIIVHVKQPVRGKRKKIRLFHGDVGHTFITLIKYNSDGTNVVRTFGFYPRKSLPLEATPLIPGTAADFKNDAMHDWDESVGRFITRKQFDLIIELTKQYARKRYHLSKNNCTDFGLNIASIAGIYIKDTKGKWLLGGGNDPADMGQSIREDKVVTNGGNLFICVPD